MEVVALGPKIYRYLTGDNDEKKKKGHNSVL